MHDTIHYTEKNVKAYRIVMSRGDDLQIDEAELEKVFNAIATGSPAVLKRGIFNPSFYVSVVFDEKRVMEFIDEYRSIERHNEQQRKYHDGTNIKELPGFVPLKDIFEGTQLSKLIAQKNQLSSGDRKQLK